MWSSSLVWLPGHVEGADRGIGATHRAGGCPCGCVFQLVPQTHDAAQSARGVLQRKKEPMHSTKAGLWESLYLCEVIHIWF